MERLPYIDEHAARVPANRARVWKAVESYVGGLIRANERNPLATLLGAQPAGGFAVAESEPERRLVLRGRHRFARYELAFELADAEDGFATQLRAQTHAAFPGLRGRVYRALVIGSRGHVVATRHMLGQIARRAR